MSIITAKQKHVGTRSLEGVPRSAATNALINKRCGESRTYETVSSDLINTNLPWLTLWVPAAMMFDDHKVDEIYELA